mmetsp:Transcript_14071/g.34869  ORF Transcript_14071/g.34869 Transcript_14071/m.34869 type:complete len:235 (-) Transcript_14071:85-789(-)
MRRQSERGLWHAGKLSLFVRVRHQLVELVERDLAVSIGIAHADHLVDLVIRRLLPHQAEDVLYLRRTHEIVVVQVESLESLFYFFVGELAVCHGHLGLSCETRARVPLAHRRGRLHLLKCSCHLLRWAGPLVLVLRGPTTNVAIALYFHECREDDANRYSVNGTGTIFRKIGERLGPSGSASASGAVVDVVVVEPAIIRKGNGLGFAFAPVNRRGSDPPSWSFFSSGTSTSQSS